MLNECHILTQLLPGLPVSASAAVGPGDDCAALRTSGGGPLLLAAVDQVIAEVHFAAASTSPERAGAKLVKRNLSDIAAMGGTPRWALLAFAARNRSETWILEFCRGAADAGMRYGVPLVGGDIAELASDGVCASLAILGEVAENEIVLRRGGEAGGPALRHGVYRQFVSFGTPSGFHSAPGGGAVSRRAPFRQRDARHQRWTPARRLASRDLVSGGADGGAGTDSAPGRSGAGDRLERRGGLRIVVYGAGGCLAQLEELWPPEFAPLTRIGSVSAGSGEVLDPGGNSLTEHRKSGYEH
ncbi:MAG: AIR synthase related protein [Lentisphaeria bacterium]|nr:MAG: AIR synthase related protein [Lentisphaeria bacterium]